MSGKYQVLLPPGSPDTDTDVFCLAKGKPHLLIQLPRPQQFTAQQFSTICVHSHTSKDSKTSTTIAIQQTIPLFRGWWSVHYLTQVLTYLESSQVTWSVRTPPPLRCRSSSRSASTTYLCYTTTTDFHESIVCTFLHTQSPRFIIHSSVLTSISQICLHIRQGTSCRDFVGRTSQTSYKLNSPRRFLLLPLLFAFPLVRDSPNPISKHQVASVDLVGVISGRTIHGTSRPLVRFDPLPRRLPSAVLPPPRRH